MRARPGTVTVLALPLVVGLLALPRATQADEAVERLRAAAETVAAAQSALLAWAAGDPVHAPAIGLTELQPLHADRWSAVDGTEAGSFTQLVLTAAAGQLEEARTRLLEVRQELGAPAWPAPPQVVATADFRGLSGVEDPETPYLGLGGRELPEPEVTPEPALRHHSGAILSFKPRDVLDSLVGENTPGAYVDGSETGVLILKLSPDGVARARRVLGFAREMVRPSLSLDVRLVRMKHALASELLALSQGPALTAEAKARLAAALSQGGCELLLEQTLAAAPGATVHAFAGGERHAPVEIAGVATASAATEARTGTILTGACVELRAAAIPGTELVDLAARVALVEPETSLPARVLGSAVDLPELSFSRARARAAIPLGQSSVVLGTFSESNESRAEAPRSCVLVVTPTRIAAPPAPVLPEPVAEPTAAPSTLGPPLPLPEGVLRIDSLLGTIDRALAAAKACRPYELACYPLHDLLDLAPVVSATPLGLSGPGTRGVPAPRGSRTSEGDYETERLESWVRNLSGSDETWGDPANLQDWKGSFVVNQTPAVHPRIERALRMLRLGRNRVFHVAAALYRIEPDLLDSILQSAREGGAGGGELPAAALERLDEGKKAGKASIETGASGLARTGTTLALQLGRERRFVAGYAPGQERGQVRALLGIARTGFEVEASVRDESGGYALEAELRHVRPAGAHPTTLAGGPVEGPALDVEVSSVRVLLSPGSGTLVAFRRGTPGAPVPCWVVRVLPVGGS